MTDEELAEDWWNSWVVKDWNDLQEGKRLFIQAFIAGRESGRHTEEQLVKAKELLKKVIKSTWNIGYFAKKEIEQFLEEAEQ